MLNFPEFRGFNKIPRLSREILITEKIDGTCGLICIDEDNNLFIGSKNRWLDEKNENHGFWHWAMERKEELLKLGKGYHYGEFWGKGIQRGYGLEEKRFSLFNATKWIPADSVLVKEKEKLAPACCHIVPILYQGIFDTGIIEVVLKDLVKNGSYASEGFMQPEGIIVYHLAGGYYFKKTILNDEKGKEQ